MNINFKKYLLRTTASLDCKETEVIQSLWSGYGKISRYTLESALYDTVVVKNISLNNNQEHPRGWNTDIGHNRKVTSYEVETHWYKKWSTLCNDNCKIPTFIGSYKEANDQWIILEDLDTEFPERKNQITLQEIKACLQWLANFHATFLNQKPNDLWPIGTYWHLDTRPDEFEKIEHEELKAKAHLIDEQLNNCKYQTIVHGDAKLANFCFSKDKQNMPSVAAVDFQYVGGGCGMKDMAYFLSSCLSGDELKTYEKELLDFYFSNLKNTPIQNIDYNNLENEWRIMYPIACADFTRFLLGWMPNHQKVNPYQLNVLSYVLKQF